MVTSYNGWPASKDRAAIGIVPLVVAGVPFVPGVRKGDVHTVLGYVATQFDKRVEPLVDPGCWGYFYRQNRNADNLSCHSSGTAIDCNAPQHNNGHEATTALGGFTRKQVNEIHKILAEIPELADVVHWGGDWHRANDLTPDPMHFEIHNHDTAALARVAARITSPQEDDMALTADEQKQLDAIQKNAYAIKTAMGKDGHITKKLERIEAALDALAKNAGVDLGN